MTIGGERLSDVEVRYADKEHPYNDPHLAFDILGQYRLLIDYPARLAYLKKPDASDKDAASEFQINIGKYLNPQKKPK